MFKYWMTDHDKYRAGYKNRIDNIKYFEKNNIEIIKHWLYDHGNGENSGGVLVFGVYCTNWETNNVLPFNSEHSGEYLITQLGNFSGSHAMTIVGYNDSIKFDFNGDGQFTNPQGDMSNWEIGAFKVANSWGNTWKNGGFIWLPYRLFFSNNHFQSKPYTCIITEPIYKEEISVKASISYPKRSKLDCFTSSAKNANIAYNNIKQNYGIFKRQGGLYKMRGVYDGPIEVGFNFGERNKGLKIGKVFFGVQEYEDSNPTEGVIHNFSLVDYRWGETFELQCKSTEVPIKNNDKTILSIEYDLLPHENSIIDTMLFSSNMVSRFTTTIANGGIMVVDFSVNIDMYNSNIVVQEGSVLYIKDNAQITSKRGVCKIIINGGQLILGKNVKFNSEEGSKLYVITNTNHFIVSNNTNYSRTGFIGIKGDLTFNNSIFNDCDSLVLAKGNISIDSCTFNSTEVYIGHRPSGITNSISITNSIINNPDNNNGIEINHYPNYFINNNIIKSQEIGLQLSNCGYGISGNQVINKNDISNCNNAGLILYSSMGEITNNHIINNNIGIKLLNRSNFAIYGYQNASSLYETNVISNNAKNELYISQYSYPNYLRYNTIMDNINSGQPYYQLLYYNADTSIYSPNRDIRFNYWGPNFNASQDLYPSQIFNYYPTWIPTRGSFATNFDIVEQIYINGIQNFKSELFDEANTCFRSIIEEYPTTELASNSMKEIFKLEKYLSNDYQQLISFYASDNTIQNTPKLQKLASSLIAKCNTVLEQWQNAIDYYTQIIANHETYEDSVFAAIDLNEVYLLMEESVRKGSTNSSFFSELNSNKKIQHCSTKSYLLSTIPNNCKQNYQIDFSSFLSIDNTSQNFPNPFSETTWIQYSVKKRSSILITIQNTLGQTIKTINEGMKEKGVYKTIINFNSKPKGIYYYTITVNGIPLSSKKMLYL